MSAPDLDHLTAAIRRIAHATYYEAGEKQRLLAQINRLEDERARLLDRVLELEAGRRSEMRVALGVPFGSLRREAS